MLDINTDGSDLIRQMEEVRTLFSRDDTTFDERTAGYTTYFGLVESYELLTGHDFSDENFSSSFEEEGSDYLFQRDKKQHQNFLNQKSFHTRLMFQTYQQADMFLQSFYDSLYAERLQEKAILPIDMYYEDRRLLYDYFEACAPHLRELYEEVSQRGNLYSSDFCGGSYRAGLTAFNVLRESSNVFLPPRCDSFQQLTAAPHEFGHVYDFSDAVSKFSNQDVLSLVSSSCFSEVLSIYYEQQFIDFYLEYGDRQDDALLTMASLYDNRLSYMWDSFVLSSLPRDALEKIYGIPVELSRMEDGLFRLGILSEEAMSYDDSDRLIDVDISTMYGYGFLISNYLLEHPDIFPKFMQLRNQEFSPEVLGDMGMTPDTLTKSLVKRSEKIYGKYL